MREPGLALSVSPTFYLSAIALLIVKRIWMDALSGGADWEEASAPALFTRTLHPHSSPALFSRTLLTCLHS
jgi:hypothetical protein